MPNILYYWIGIIFCIIQSGLTSGLTLALYGFPRLMLESEASAKNIDAIKVLKLRKDSHLLLATLIWANVSVNVLLAFLTEAIMGTFAGFVFTTFLITFFGEIFPQAFISKRALSTGAKLVPLINLYKILMYPLARPTGILLDRIMGKEDINYLNEETIKSLLKKHLESSGTEIDKLEGQGALNFLSMDDMFVRNEGEIVDPESIFNIESENIQSDHQVGNLPKEFLTKLARIEKKWAILIDNSSNPIFVLNINALIRKYFCGDQSLTLGSFCHRPIIVREPNIKFADTVLKLKVLPEHSEDDVIDQDVILYWTTVEKKIVTGADILGRLLRGIVTSPHR